MPMILTARQEAILTFCVQHMLLHCWPPTIREIGKAFDIHSTNGVSDHLIALQRRGYLNLKSGRQRGMTFTRAAFRRVPPPPGALLRYVPLEGEE
jgi:repressor LexA